MNDTVRGSVKFWAVRREPGGKPYFLGWGFVALDDKRQAFLHYSALPAANIYTVETGDRLDCSVALSERGLSVTKAVPILDSAGEVVNISNELEDESA